MRTLGGIALATLVLAGCDYVTPQGSTGSPISLTPGTVQEQLRQQQLQNAASNPGIQNPLATGASPGAGGIERSGVGTGNASGGAVGAINPGTTGISRPGVGAPAK
jgi:hypothetical protein